MVRYDNNSTRVHDIVFAPQWWSAVRYKARPLTLGPRPGAVNPFARTTALRACASSTQRPGVVRPVDAVINNNHFLTVDQQRKQRITHETLGRTVKIFMAALLRAALKRFRTPWVPFFSKRYCGLCTRRPSVWYEPNPRPGDNAFTIKIKKSINEIFCISFGHTHRS